MAPEFKEGAPWWGSLSPDRLGLRVEASVLNLERVEDFRCQGPVTITNAGGQYWDLSIHAEGLLPWQPLLPQVASWLCFLAIQGVFIDDLAACLLLTCHTDWDWASTFNLQVYLRTLEVWGFRLVELEVAIDFPVRERPFRLRRKTDGKKYRSTRYSLDAVTYRRVRRLADGTSRIESKASRKSLVAEYDRAKKTGSSGYLWRVELRLQRHHIDRLGPYELVLDFHRWMCLRFWFLVKITRKSIMPGTWNLQPAALATQPFFVRLFASAVGWI